MADVIPPRAPNLPVATIGYEPRYIDQFANILRLYFNTVDNAFAAALEQLRTGQFDSLTANNFYGGNFSGNSFSGNTLIGDIINAKIANLTAINTGSVAGGNGVFANLTASNVNASLFTGAGHQINYPYVGATKTADDYAAGDNTATVVEFDSADEIRGWTFASNTFTAEHSGVYKLDYSLQFANTDNDIHDVVVWLKVNGNDLTKSATKFTIPARKSAGVYAYICAYSTIMFQVADGDDIELYWATDKAYSTTGPVDGVYIEYVAAQTVPYAHPSIPASIITITYVSAPVPAKTQIVPTGVSGVGKVGSIDVVIT